MKLQKEHGGAEFLLAVMIPYWRMMKFGNGLKPLDKHKTLTAYEANLRNSLTIPMIFRPLEFLKYFPKPWMCHILAIWVVYVWLDQVEKLVIKIKSVEKCYQEDGGWKWFLK